MRRGARGARTRPELTAFAVVALLAGGACIPDVAPVPTNSDARGTGGATSSGAAWTSTTSGTGGAGGAACVGEAPVDLCKGGCVAARDRCGGAVDCGPCAIWAKSYGGPGTAIGAGVAIDGAGDVAVAGTFSGTVDFGDGPRAALGAGDIFVVKLDPKGKHLWTRTFGGNDAASSTLGDAAQGVAFDGVGDVFLTGSIASATDFGGGPLVNAGGTDVFVAKLGPDGAHVWSRRFGTPTDGEKGMGIAVDPFGDVVVSATVAAAVDFGDGKVKKLGAVAVKLGGADGATRWSWGATGTIMRSAYGVAVAGDGSSFVAGCFFGGLALGNGIKLGAPGYGSDAFLVKLDATGSPVWGRQFGDSKSQCGLAVGVDASGDVVLTGAMISAADFGGGKLTAAGAAGDGFAAAFDGAGKPRYSRIFHSPSPIDDQAGAAWMTPDGHAWIAGDADGPIDLGGGAPSGATSEGGGYLLELDAAGTYIGSRRVTGAALHTQEMRGVAGGPKGEIAVCGSSIGASKLDEITIGGAGVYHAFVMTLAR